MAAARSLQRLIAVGFALGLASPALSQEPVVHTGRLSSAAGQKGRMEYPFEVAAGQSIEVKLSSEAFDTFLELIPPQGDPFYRAPLTNDDAEGGTDSRLTAISSSAGTWRAVATAYEQGEGEFRLEIFVGGAGRIQNVASRALTESDSMSIKGRRYAVHGVNLDGNAQVVIEMAADGFGPMIIAEGPNGERQTSEVQEDGGTARLEIGQPEEGRWRIVATQATPEDALGNYALRLIQMPGGESNATTGELTENDPVDLEGEHYDVHRIESSAERAVVITLASDDFDAFLAARSSSGQWLRDDDSGGETTARLELPRGSGTWQVFVTSYSGDETGSYRLTITR